MKILLKKNRRGIFYGFAISIGLIFLHELIILNSLREFLIGSIILYFIFLFELYTNWFYARKVLSQMGIPAADTYSSLSQITHHVLLPTILYISYLGLIYFYELSIPRLVIFFFSFFSFSMLFINIRAYYEDKFKLEEKTHFIFDIIKFLTFFQVTTAILKIEEYYAHPLFYSILFIFLISVIINIFTVIRHRQFNVDTFIFVLVFSIVIGLAAYLLITYTSFNNLAISSYLILVFYISSATIHHKLEGSLTRNIILEYFAVMLLSLVLIQGLSN